MSTGVSVSLPEANWCLGLVESDLWSIGTFITTHNGLEDKVGQAAYREAAAQLCTIVKWK